MYQALALLDFSIISGEWSTDEEDREDREDGEDREDREDGEDRGDRPDGEDREYEEARKDGESDELSMISILSGCISIKDKTSSNPSIGIGSETSGSQSNSS